MSKSLLDTDILSELMRPAPEPIVERWLAAQPDHASREPKLSFTSTKTAGFISTASGSAKTPPERPRTRRAIARTCLPG